MINHESNGISNKIWQYKGNSEETSTVSNISYEIENANNSGLKQNKIDKQIKSYKKNKFPKIFHILKVIRTPKQVRLQAPFKDTGKVTLGMTGTNVHKDAILKQTFGVPSYQGYIDASETLKDIGADVNIGLHSVTDKDPHYKNTQDFIKISKRL